MKKYMNFSMIKWIYKQRTYIKYALIFTVVLRFLWLNYINYSGGELTTGKPGVQTWMDTERYTMAADDLIAGRESEGRVNQYLGYVYIIAACKAMNLPMEVLIVFQILIALVSALALYDIVKKNSGSSFAGIIAAAFLLGNPFIVTWHTFIMTESLYGSFVVFSCWVIDRMVREKEYKVLIWGIPVVAYTVMLRPNGWIFVPVFFSFLMVSFTRKKMIRYVAVFLVIVAFIAGTAVISSVRKSIQYVNPTELLMNGVVIWGHPEYNIKMPADTTIKGNDWVSGFRYALNSPGSSFKLAVKRVVTSLIQIRPWQSVKYKIRMLIWLIPAYILALFGIFKYGKHPIVMIVLSIIMAHLMITALTHACHESRFINYILPMFYVLSGIGAGYWLNRLRLMILKSCRPDADV